MRALLALALGWDVWVVAMAATFGIVVAVRLAVRAWVLPECDPWRRYRRSIRSRVWGWVRRMWKGKR